MLAEGLHDCCVDCRITWVEVTRCRASSSSSWEKERCVWTFILFTVAVQHTLAPILLIPLTK